MFSSWRSSKVAVKNLRVATITAIIWLFSMVGFGQPQTHSAALTNSDVLDLVKANISADVIVAKIKSSDCRFETSPATLKNLKDAGVPDNVVLAMIEAPSAPERIA